MVESNGLRHCAAVSIAGGRLAPGWEACRRRSRTAIAHAWRVLVSCHQNRRRLRRRPAHGGSDGDSSRADLGGSAGGLPSGGSEGGVHS